MDNTTWAFGPDGPQWPVDGGGQKEKAVRLMNSFDSAAVYCIPPLHRGRTSPSVSPHRGC